MRRTVTGDDDALTAIGWPEIPFNPLAASAAQPLTPTEILLSPFGLLLFAPLAPLVRLAGRWQPRAALLGGSLLWLIASTGPLVLPVFVGAVVAGATWVVGLGWLRRREALSERGMAALVWIGLLALGLPLWWRAHWGWYAGWDGGVSRLSPYHMLGLSYVQLRLIAWGVNWAKAPQTPLRLFDTALWLLYPPTMRLGPVTLRETFLERLDAWRPREPLAWRDLGRRVGYFVMGGVLYGIVLNQVPKVPPGAVDFFSAPEHYATEALLRLAYLAPIQVFLMLWLYNELAAALAIVVGIRVDDNFRWVPAATSVRDYWRRWHMTLGAWLREYVYIPLGGNRRHVLLTYGAVFVFCGAWHGAAWSYVLWGALQALALGVQRGWDGLRQRLFRQYGEGSPRTWLRAAWLAVCWLATMQFQLLATIIFLDFSHAGLPLLGELLRRATGWGW